MTAVHLAIWGICALATAGDARAVNGIDFIDRVGLASSLAGK